MQKDGEDRAAASVSPFQLPVNTTTLADYVRPPTQALSCADQPQYGSPFPMKRMAPHEFSQTPSLPHLPPFTVFPADANRINLRALAQSNRYTTTQLKAQETKDIGPSDVLKIGDASVTQAPDGFEFRSVPAKQDLDAAGILFEVAKEQEPISAALNTGIIPANTGGEFDADASMDCSQKCPVTSCEYHDKGFSTKVERDKHTMTHFEGAFRCSWCIDYHLTSLKLLDDHMHKHHKMRLRYFDWMVECCICHQLFRSSRYAEHLDDCMVHAVELEASGKYGRCPVTHCGHFHGDFPSKQHKAQHMMCHYWAKVNCRWCDQRDNNYTLEEFKSHLSEEHGSDHRRHRCPICLSRFSLNGKQLLEHLDSCISDWVWHYIVM